MSVIRELEEAGEVLSPAVRAAIVVLEARIRELERRLGLNSTNSSRPPSSDPPGLKRRPKRKPSGKKPGAQPGHEAHQRELLPPERVDRALEHWPEACATCGHRFALFQEMGTPERRQVIELPPVRAQVTEHRLHRLVCPVCRQATKAVPPGDVGPGTTCGPRLVGFMATLTVRLRASRRGLQALLSDLLDVEPPSVGLLQKLLGEASTATLAAYEEVGRALRASPAVGVDETGWKKKGLRHWLWTGVTEWLSFFRLTRRRSAEERKALLGPDYSGVVTSDRAGAYNDLERRQLCWAHLKRDLEAWMQRGGRAAALGRWATAEVERMFGLWHRFRAGEITRGELVRRLRPLQARMTRLFYQAALSGDEKVEKLAIELLLKWEMLFRFAEQQGVEPTNNEAERALRAGVIWRKISFGSKSDDGLRMVERLLTVAETAKKQKRDLLEYLTAAITAHRLGQTPPALLARA